MINRKLVRPNLAEMKERFSTNRPPQAASDAVAPEAAAGREPGRRRQVPPENTSAEAFYYVKQMNNRTPMVVVLDDGEELRGHIEWYDRSCIKLNRDDGPNLVIYKHSIKYLLKADELRNGASPT